jgi:hypothetical protein
MLQPFGIGVSAKICGPEKLIKLHTITRRGGGKLCDSLVSKAYGLSFFAEQNITGTLHALTLWNCGRYYSLKKTLVKHSPSNTITYSSTSQFFNNHKYGGWIDKGRPTEWHHIPKSTSITLSFLEDMLRRLSIHLPHPNTSKSKQTKNLQSCNVTDTHFKLHRIISRAHIKIIEAIFQHIDGFKTKHKSLQQQYKLDITFILINMYTWTSKKVCYFA